MRKRVRQFLDWIGVAAHCRLQNGGREMAAESRVKVTLECTECKQRNYDTMKNKKNDPERIEMRKYCKFCRTMTVHKETK